MIRELDELERSARERVARAGGEEALEALRIELLGRREGRLTAILRRLGELEPADRPAVGKRGNEVKEAVTGLLERRAEELSAAGPAGPDVDLTLPGRRRWTGGRHPVTQVIDEIHGVFRSMGFVRARGPEAETDWHNFEALNTPLDHPAAAPGDTFYLDEGVLLRSHTSPVQIRTMMAHEPPIRILAPGLVYRRDPWDPSHAPAFEQIEGLVVDEGITMGDLKATLAEFARRLFGSETRTRFRPSFFPFTEPSAEVDVTCPFCDTGCSTCKGTRWLEIMGAGMVDPAVFEAVGYDPERYTGFAFGMGPGRIAMNVFGVPDIRMWYEGDTRFLEQFA
ncbi:MAG: phenylalanine--tRNA ligase subunit alpha [Gemmatimonadetes bacterium]|nr:phenylalanine--tRNA ligase subunit alpha [Gemmatimonadota bacterium]NIQ56133.1 phenylalanine--tRNA ligase subunit alpha [Gemmatimonadota bacterium]NIU76320.1 phenylalanine--tRNA ligase subunit alpha [Gammaproteobacteria bacterium]NIX45819.1 phenylalanine--tRNA ligase subunit alpha [Gemmatimonadota bacterium]NIY10128.1 phenylalanine--tRNA ligase subunit alpha [Gemmatimonadota bacterium]